MDKIIPDGIPHEQDYYDLIKSGSINEMESFSSDFLSINKEYLKIYNQTWVNDPLHQWSRQWEYPFVLSKIKEFFLKMQRLTFLMKVRFNIGL